MALLTKPELLRRYSQALASGDASLFVGAGISHESGIVDWRELMREVATELGLDVSRETDLIAVAQYHVNERGGRARLNQLLIEEFTKGSALTENHRIISSLPLRTVWTTNYDQLLESAFRDANKRPDVKTSNENLAQTTPQRDVTIYKMHGDVAQPQDAVLTKEDYELYAESRPLFSTLLKGELVSKTFLFIGFSFTDPNIDYILSRIRSLLGQNTREHFCIMKWPTRPGADGAAIAQYEYDRRKLELRISDLKRYGIQAVMVDEYTEITKILQELALRSHVNDIFVSGSAHEYGPLGRDRVEKLARRIGHEIIRRDRNLVSGFGLGIGGAVIIGALQSIYERGLSMARVQLFPFPQQLPPSVEKSDFYRTYRENIIKNAGFTIILSGNRLDPANGETVVADGVLEEFEITTDLKRFPIPVGATGFAALKLWKQVSTAQEIYYPEKDVRRQLQILGNVNSTDDEIIDAIFEMIRELSR